MNAAEMSDVARADDNATGRQAIQPARVTRFDRWLAERVQRKLDPAAVGLQLWDGTSAAARPTELVGTIRVHDRDTLIGLITNPELQFGEAYMTGRLEVVGDFQGVIDAISARTVTGASWFQRLRAAAGRVNTRAAARRNVHHHYDLGNDFYQLWLDREMVYTCAYYASPDLSLDAAQRAKMDLVCRKLRLRPDETVVEAGCGWGALALHMAREYGVRVRAFNLSREQLAFARDRAAREGLAGRVEFIEDDYRNVHGQYDVFASVGMLEHVGLAHFRSLSAVLGRTLKRHGGRGLLHFIGRDVPRPLNAWIRRRIFPGGYAPTLGQVTSRVLAPAGMSVLDVENLRLHYARTLAHWADRFAAARDRVRDRYGVEFARAWELYLAGSQAAFTTGWMQLFQVVFAPYESAPPSWTRRDPFEPSGTAP